MGCLHIYLFVCLFVYVFVCGFVCVSVSACVSLTSYACLYVSLCVFICVCLCALMCLCVSVVLGGVYVCVTVCLRMHLCLSACVHVAGASLWLTLRGRGLPLHLYTPVTHVDQWYPVEHSLIVGFIYPTKLSPHCLSPCMCREKRGGDPWRTVTTALSESSACPPIKALIRSPFTDAEIESRSV